MGQMKSDMSVFINSNEIKDIISTLAEEINEDYKDNEVILVSPLKGSFLFVSDFIRKLEISHKIDFVRMDSPKGAEVRILKDISENIKNKHILIVEEIIDAGRTLSFLRNRLLMNQPASLKILTLLDKPARRELPLKPDYIGKVIDDRYVIGYGMDSKEIGRNYGDIYAFKQ